VQLTRSSCLRCALLLLGWRALRLCVCCVCVCEMCLCVCVCVVCVCVAGMCVACLQLCACACVLVAGMCLSLGLLWVRRLRVCSRPVMALSSRGCVGRLMSAVMGVLVG
jgi:hypothetical protein